MRTYDPAMREDEIEREGLPGSIYFAIAMREAHDHAYEHGCPCPYCVGRSDMPWTSALERAQRIRGR
jgi:hypothetical protein